MAGIGRDLDIVHCHTWYSHFAGCLVQAAPGRAAGADHPLARAASSLEGRAARHRLPRLAPGSSGPPTRTPTASSRSQQSMKHDVQSICYGVARRGSASSTTASTWSSTSPRPDPSVLARFGIEPGVPFVLFVGRITRQKGIIHLVNAIRTSGPASRWCSAPARPTRRRSARRWPEAVEQARARTSPDPSSGSRRCCRKDRDHLAVHARRDLRLPVGLRAVRHHQPGSDGLRDAGGRLGGGGHPEVVDARRNGPARRASKPSARPTSSRAIPITSPATSPPPSTPCSTIPRCATAWPHRRGPASSRSFRGPASRGRRSSSTRSWLGPTARGREGRARRVAPTLE